MSANPPPPPGATVRLALLFGTLYFVQGFGEPTEGLVAQPTRSLLKGWGYGTGEITQFMFVLGLPWLVKPFMGLLCDFVPLRGSHRRSYLLLTTLLTTLGLAGAYAMPPGQGAVSTLLLLLFLPGCGIAFSDVVADAHMVETGKPLGITGLLQSVQWTALYGAGLITGSVAGYLTENGLHSYGYLLCGALALISFSTCWVFVREPPRQRPEVGGLREALWTLLRAARSPVVLGVGGFLFLLNFNPFSATIQNEYCSPGTSGPAQPSGPALRLQGALPPALVAPSRESGNPAARIRSRWPAARSRVGRVELRARGRRTAPLLVRLGWRRVVGVPTGRR